MEKKRPYRKFNFGIGNYFVRSMWKKSIRKRKDHIENLILELEIMLLGVCGKRVYGKESHHIEKKEAIF